jgi:hypothetical protein
MLVRARGAQAGANLLKSGVGMTRMADELPGRRLIGRHSCKNGAERCANGIRSGDAGGQNTNRAGRSLQPRIADKAQKRSMLRPQGDHSDAPERRGSGCRTESPGRLKGISDGGNPADGSSAQERAQDS